MRGMVLETISGRLTATMGSTESRESPRVDRSKKGESPRVDGSKEGESPRGDGSFRQRRPYASQRFLFFPGWDVEGWRLPCLPQFGSG